MYEKIINKWFEKRETPNHQFDILNITALLLGYYDEAYHKGAIEHEAKRFVVEELGKLGYTKTAKKFIFSDGTELPCYFNISFRKIKEIIKPFSQEGDMLLTGYMHTNRKMHRIGWILKMYDSGFKIIKSE